MENGERGEPRGIVKTERRIWAMTSAQQRPLWRIFSTHSPSIRPGLTLSSVLVSAENAPAELHTQRSVAL